MSNTKVMQMLGGPFRVYVGLAPMGYLNVPKLRQTIREGIIFCGISSQLEKLPRPSKITVKPNVIFAHPTFSRYSYTHPEVVSSTLSSIFSFAPGAQTQIVEKSYADSPTRKIFKRANGYSENFKHNGYYELERIFPGQVTLTPIEESPLCRYQLSKGEAFNSNADTVPSDVLLRARNEIITSSAFSDTHFNVCIPKLQTSLYSKGFSGALATAGSLDTAYEIQGSRHDHVLCDGLEVSFPQLIVSDGIIVPAGGSYLSQRGHELGIVLVSNNAVAHDWVAARIFNLDPLKIPLIKIATERGWGPANPNVIEIGGGGKDSLPLLSQKTQYWDLGLQNISDFNKSFPFEFIENKKIESRHSDVLLDWLYQIYNHAPLRPDFSKTLPISVVIGKADTYPRYRQIVLLGDDAISSFKLLTSTTRKIFHTKLFSIEKVQLKNGKRHWLFKIPDRSQPLLFASRSEAKIPPSNFAISIVFALATRIGFSLAWIFFFFRKPRKMDSKRYSRLPIILTHRFFHNRWWTLSHNWTKTQHHDQNTFHGRSL